MKAETCNTCKQPFKRAHHWHRVYRHFLWFHWSYRVHHNCHHPEMGPSKVHRLPGELPLPFPEPENGVPGEIAGIG